MMFFRKKTSSSAASSPGIAKPKQKESKQKTKISVKQAKNEVKVADNTSQATSKGPTLLVNGERVFFHEDPIGRGASSVVLKGDWDKRTLAVKVFTAASTTVLGENEKNVLSELKHQYIIPLHGHGYVGTVKKQLCLLLKYGEHGTLHDRLGDKSFELDWPLRIKIATQIAEAMSYTHEKDYIHGDLKSNNILLTSGAGGMEVNIFDFETARKPADTSRLPPVTINWAAPEVLTSNRVSFKSDIYSYGMILYELATRKIPYKEDLDPTSVHTKIASGILPDLVDVPRPYAELIKECWAFNPVYRPTFSEILEKLNNLNIKDNSEWDEFFLNCGIHPTQAKEYASLFEKNDLTIGDLGLLDHSMLQSMGLEKVKDRVEILTARDKYIKSVELKKMKRTFELLVELKNEQKRVVVEVSNVTELKNELRRQIESLRDDKELELVYYDQQFQSYPDLDDINQLSLHSVIKPKTHLKESLYSSNSSSVYALRESTQTIRSSEGTSVLFSTSLQDVRREEKVGKGNFGTVYKGYSGLTPIVLKKLITKDEKSNLKELEAEASMLNRLRNPFVVQFLGACDFAGEKYMCTEYMKDGSLDKFLTEHKDSLTVPILLQMAATAAIGMEYLASQKVIHRDIAARNFLVAHQGNEYTLKVADFGLAVLLEGELYNSSSPVPVRWTALEGLLFSAFTLASDVWSFGVVMWEMFDFGVHIPYYELANQNDVISYLKSGKRIPKSDNCPQGIYELMLACWNAEPKQRPNYKQIHATVTREKCILLGEEVLEKHIVREDDDTPTPDIYTVTNDAYVQSGDQHYLNANEVKLGLKPQKSSYSEPPQSSSDHYTMPIAN